MVGRLPPAQPVPNQYQDDLLVPVAAGLKEILFEPISPFRDRPAFVAGPRPDTGIGRAVQDITRLNCRIWASRDKSGYSARVNQYNGEVCGPYLDDLNENPTPGFVGPPFEGGQCDAVYLVTATRTTNLSGTSNITLRARGPVGGVRVRQVLGNNYDWELFCSGLNAGASNCGPLAASAPGWYRIGGVNSSDGEVSASILSVVPCGADNCGNPPPVLQPPATVTPVTPIVPDIEVDLPGVGPVNINVDIDNDGNLVVTAPDVGANVTIAPDVDLGGGGDGGGGSVPPLDPEVGEPIDSLPGGGGGGNDTDFGEAPEGRIWVGAYVQLLGDLIPFGVIPGDQVGQSALSTVVGNASLNVDGEGSLRFRSTYTQIRSEWSEHIVPVVGLPVAGIRVKVNPALGYRVYPVSVVDPLAEST